MAVLISFGSINNATLIINVRSSKSRKARIMKINRSNNLKRKKKIVTLLITILKFKSFVLYFLPEFEFKTF